jgi:hypothetical protein
VLKLPQTDAGRNIEDANSGEKFINIVIRTKDKLSFYRKPHCPAGRQGYAYERTFYPSYK